MDVSEALATFAAVARARSFTRGAEAVGVPQPVASRRVAALEQRWGVSLLRRTSRSVELTDEGARLLPLAEEVVTGLQRIDRLFPAIASELVVAVPRGLPARARATIRRGLEGRRVCFEAGDPASRAASLREGRCHLALLPAPADEAEVHVDLGLATAEPGGSTPTHPGAADVVALASLRRPLSPRGARPRCLHVLAEDDVTGLRERVREAAAAAGLRADQLALGTEPDEAWTRAHQWDDVVLATRAEATLEEVRFSRSDLTLVRGYRLRGTTDLVSEEECGDLRRRLAVGLGGRVVR